MEGSARGALDGLGALPVSRDAAFWRGLDGLRPSPVELDLIDTEQEACCVDVKDASPRRASLRLATWRRVACKVCNRSERSVPVVLRLHATWLPPRSSPFTAPQHQTTKNTQGNPPFDHEAKDLEWRPSAPPAAAFELAPHEQRRTEFAFCVHRAGQLQVDALARVNDHPWAPIAPLEFTAHRDHHAT